MLFLLFEVENSHPYSLPSEVSLTPQSQIFCRAQFSIANLAIKGFVPFLKSQSLVSNISKTKNYWQF